MVGSRTGETHRLGDKVTVRLAEAAPVAGALRFELLSEGRFVAGRSRPAGMGRKDAREHRHERPYRGKRRR